MQYEPLGVIIVSQTLDTTTRLLNVRLKAKAVDMMTGDLRFNLWITEDSIKAYQASAPDPNKLLAQRRAAAFPRRAVGRARLAADDADARQEVTYDFQYTLPAGWKLKQLKTIGVVRAYATGAYARRIVNSAWAKTLTTVTGMRDVAVVSEAKIYPNPAADKLWLELGETAEIRDATLTVFNSAGRVVMQQPVVSRTEVIDVRALPAWPYWLRTGSGSTQGFVKQ